MSYFPTFKGMPLLTTLRRRSTSIGAIVVLAVFLSTGSNLTHARKLSRAYNARVLAPTISQPVQLQIEDTVKGLEYSDAVAESFIRMVRSWKEVHGQPDLVSLSETLSRSRSAFSGGQMSESELVEIEEAVILELGQSIRRNITYRGDYFDLADIVDNGVANCFGYSQMLYILGHSIGLSVYVASVMPEHTVNIMFPADGTMTIVDLTRADLAGGCIVKGKRLAGNGTHWKLDGIADPTGQSNSIHIFSKNELVSEIHFSRGTIEYASGQGAEAVSHYDRAIELNPRSAKAYNNRGGSYLLLNEHSKAISSFNHAIEIDPKLTSAHQNRANAYLDSGQYAKAISDYTHTIELDSNFAKALLAPGHAHLFLEDYARAEADYTGVIRLIPDSARAYYMRGICNAYLAEGERAKRDMLRAVELDGTLKTEVEEMSKELELDLTLGQSRLPG